MSKAPVCDTELDIPLPVQPSVIKKIEDILFITEINSK